MKKYYFVLVLIFVVNLLSAQNIPSYVPKDGLVGYWPFNGNANDESGNGNNGTVNGATLTTDRIGNVNSAYNFDQTRNIQNISVNLSQSFSPNAYTEYGYSFWLNSGNANLGRVFQYTGINNTNFDFVRSEVFKPVDSYSFWHYNVDIQTVSPDVLNHDKWYHIVILIKTNGKVDLYKDGKLWFSGSYSLPYKPNEGILMFGSQSNSLVGFTGKIDDFAIYNRALSDKEVQALYTGSPCANPIAQVFQPTCFLKTGQIQLKAYTGNEYSYSLDGKNYTADTMFRELAPGAYTVFVKHTSGCMDSTSVTIQQVPTSLTATTSQVGSVKICAESSMLVSTISGRNYTYQWVKDKIAIKGATSSIYEVSKAGKYSVFVNDGACSDTSDYLVLDTIPLPDAPIVNNNYIRLCDKNMNLQSIIVNNQINPSYRWYRMETGTDSLSKQSWLTIPFGSGIMTPFFLSQFSATNPACESKKRTMLILEDKTPPDLRYISNKTLCPGDSIELKVNNLGNSWELAWNKDWMQLPNSQGKTSIFVKEAGNYSVYNKQCPPFYGSNPIQITMQTVAIQDFSNYVLKNEAPIPLVGNPTGGVFTGAGVTNAVFDPSALKLGKKTIKYAYTSPEGCAGEAIKYVIVVDSTGSGCTVTKYDTVIVPKTVTKYDTVKITKYDTITVKNIVNDTVIITNNVTKYDTITLTDTVSILKLKFKLTTGLQANKMASISLYPNPTSDLLHVEVGDAKALDGYRYRIVDALGKEVYNELVKNAITGIPMKTLGAAGMYQFEVLDQKNVRIQTNKILLQ